jgi:hypothetical protein
MFLVGEFQSLKGARLAAASRQSSLAQAGRNGKQLVAKTGKNRRVRTRKPRADGRLGELHRSASN